MPYRNSKSDSVYLKTAAAKGNGKGAGALSNWSVWKFCYREREEEVGRLRIREQLGSSGAVSVWLRLASCLSQEGFGCFCGALICGQPSAFPPHSNARPPGPSYRLQALGSLCLSSSPDSFFGGGGASFPSRKSPRSMPLDPGRLALHEHPGPWETHICNPGLGDCSVPPNLRFCIVAKAHFAL